MEALGNFSTIVGIVGGVLGLIVMVSGAVAVARAVSTKAVIEALRSEMTILRSDFNDVKARLTVVETERDGLKRDVAIHFEARLLVLEENRALRSENRDLLRQLAAGA